MAARYGVMPTRRPDPYSSVLRDAIGELAWTHSAHDAPLLTLEPGNEVVTGPDRPGRR